MISCSVIGIQLVQNGAPTGCVFASWVQSLNSFSLSKESSVIIPPKGTPESIFFLFPKRRNWEFLALTVSWGWRWAKR